MNIRDQMEELKHPSERAIKQWGVAEDEFLSAVTGACLINASTATNGTRQAKGQNMRRTHKGLMYGVVPCYFDFTNRECPGVEGRFIGREALLTFCDLVFEITCYLVTLARPEYELLFPIKLTGTLDWDGEEIGG